MRGTPFEVLSPLEPLFLMLRDKKLHSQGQHDQPHSDCVPEWGWVTPQPMPRPPARRWGNGPAVPGLSTPPALATELIGPSRCLWPPVAVFPGATLHPVHQAQRGGCGVSGEGGGLFRDEGSQGPGEGISEVHGGPQLL